jgi:hypothetical protein
MLKRINEHLSFVRNAVAVSLMAVVAISWLTKNSYIVVKNNTVAIPFLNQYHNCFWAASIIFTCSVLVYLIFRYFKSHSRADYDCWGLVFTLVPIALWLLFFKLISEPHPIFGFVLIFIILLPLTLFFSKLFILYIIGLLKESE